MSCFPSISNKGIAAFQAWAPRLYGYYRRIMNKLEEHTGERRNFPGSVFACATANFGPKVCSFKHRDTLNLAYGWCAITALGNFNPKLGGHIIFWETKTVVEFPPGSTFLIPSSCLSHSNTPTQPGEYRASFTQYTAGGVFRWVENDFTTLKDLEKNHPAKYKEFREKDETRWKEGLELFSTVDELLKDI